MNEGFTQEQAEEAMQRFKNPQKALKHLKVGILYYAVNSVLLDC